MYVSNSLRLFTYVCVCVYVYIQIIKTNQEGTGELQLMCEHLRKFDC